MKTYEEYAAECPLVAILRGITPDEIEPVCDALYDGGIRLLEITLCLSLHGIPHQMLTSEIDPQCKLPIAESFMAQKGEIPSGAAVRFTQPNFASHLACH